MEIDRNVIDIQTGRVTAKANVDKIILYGKKQSGDSRYIDNIELVLYTAFGKTIKKAIPDAGYNMQLFIADFTGDGFDDIMVRGDFGGTGGFAIARIYTYDNNSLKEIFNQDMTEKLTSCSTAYLSDNRFKVECKNSKKSPYIGELSSAYNNDDNLKSGQAPIISPLNAAFPVKPTYQNYYDLLLMQKVIGLSNADTLGVIQTWITLLGDKPEVKSQGFVR